MATTLVVTNDFPPRIGGIESFVADVCRLLDDDVVVYASGPAGAAATDVERPFRVVRTGPLLLPTLSAARAATELLRESGASRVVFGAAAPLGLLAPALREAGAERIVALTHGHETWWATLPGSRALLRRVGDACDHLTTVSDYTRRRIAPALSAAARSRLLTLSPPVDLERFRPATVSASGTRPQVVSVGRFVAQKGFDVLLRAWRLVLDRWSRGVPVPELVLVGEGPRRRRLLADVERADLGHTVRLTGALPREALAVLLPRAQVFALPMRTRWCGLHPEALGLAALEAAACGLPVIVGASGGAPETVRPGVSGFVVHPQDPYALADRLTWLLADPERARAMGRAGRVLVEERFGSDRARAVLRRALSLG